MDIANKQERKVSDTLRSIFLTYGYKLSITSFRGVDNEDYIEKRERTVNGFIGYQVPREGLDRTYWNDFAVFIPDVLDIRIECKSLAVASILSRAVIVEELIITSSMPEKNLILLVEGNGFKTKEFTETIKKTKSKITELANDMTEFVDSIGLKLAT